VFSGRPIPDLVEEYAASGYGPFKEAVAEAIIEGLAPIQAAYQALDDAEVAEVMARGAATARDRAETAMKTVREKVGIV
jgi:tryptophanyl-tRNA synthetase